MILPYVGLVMKSSKTGRVRSLSLAVLGILPLLTGGCTSFSYDWQKAARQFPAPADLQGCWQGTWVSEVNGHTDSLRCVITKKDDGVYNARFLARYHKVLSFGYTVPLKVQPDADKFTFSGDANLGWLKGGLYHYEGHADVTNFFSTYRCKYDHGTFQMGRPEIPANK
jgi:hypothetical protein